MAFATMHIGAAQIRRGALFLINIGIPVLIAIFRGETQAAVLGAVTGMLLAFADNTEPLIGRLRFLAIDTAAITAGAMVGYSLESSYTGLWAVFVTMAFAAGLATRCGREATLAGRHGIMAYTVAIATPTFSTVLPYYLAGAVILNAITRAVDHLIAGPLPKQPAAPLQTPKSHAGWLRFAFAFAGALAAALVTGSLFDETHRFWVVFTTLLVMQPDAQASYLRIVERIAGTFAGVAIAWVITATFHSTVIICLAILIVAPLIPHHLTRRYWLHTGLIGLMILLSYDLMLFDSGGISHLLIGRLMDMMFGCALAFVGTTLAFPHEAAANLRKGH